MFPNRVEHPERRVGHPPNLSEIFILLCRLPIVGDNNLEVGNEFINKT